MIISKLFLACECVGFYSNKKNYANCSTLGNLLIDQFQYPILQVTLYISFTNLIFSFLFFEDLFNSKYRQTVVYLLPRSMWKIAIDHNALLSPLSANHVIVALSVIEDLHKACFGRTTHRLLTTEATLFKRCESQDHKLHMTV